MLNDSDSAAWSALVVAAFAMVIALGQLCQQYASSGHLIRLCDSVVYGGRSGLPGKGRRVWSWSQFRFRVLYDVPVFRLARGRGNVWDTYPLSSVRSTEEIDTVTNDKHWSALGPTPQVGEAAWVSFCRKIKDNCRERLIISLKHNDADRVPPELPNIPVPVSLRDVIIMAYSIGMDCTDACFTRRTLSMQGDSGVLTSSNHPTLGLVLHFSPQNSESDHPQPKQWRSWVARALGSVPVAGDILAWNGMHGLKYYENADELLVQVLQCCRTNGKLDLERATAEGDTKTVESYSSAGGSTPVIVSRGQCPELPHYWLSQMDVFHGHFATPWPDPEYYVCARGFGIILRILGFDENVGPKALMFPGDDIKTFFGNDLPLASHPPYAVNVATLREPIRPERADPPRMPPDPGWHYYPTFKCDLPKLAIVGDKEFTFDDFNRNVPYTSITDHTLFVHELMGFDHWLNKAGETAAIVCGKAMLLKHAPALCQYVIGRFYEAFRYCYVTGGDGWSCSEEIRRSMIELGLSDAEITFLIVAVLRTLRYAFCIGSGLNTKPALQIMWQDMSAHMV